MFSRDILFKKQSNYLGFWLTIIFIIIIIMSFCCFFEYNPYYTVNGIYEKEAGYVSFVLENNKLFYIYDSEIKVNKTKIDKDDIKIGEYIYLESKIYNTITIPLEEVLDGALVNISFKLPKTTILRKIWKGMME